MFLPYEKVICVDDNNPNPLLNFPCGYVVRGSVYTVLRKIFIGRGVRIEGLPVIHPKIGIDVGWKPMRFRKLDDIEKDVNANVNEEQEEELVGAI